MEILWAARMAIRGLMQYADVVTFFHEFGHMMHAVLGSHQEWVGTSSFNVEWDFVEACGGAVADAGGVLSR